jgi:hypothetical protein
MFLGTSPFAYAVLGGLAVFGGMFTSLADPFDTLRKNSLKKMYATPLFLSMGWLAVSLAAVFNWYFNTTTQANVIYKVNWILSNYAIFAIVVFVDIIARGLFMRRDSDAAADDNKIDLFEEPSSRGGRRFMFVIAVLALVTQISIAICCLWLWPTSSHTDVGYAQQVTSWGTSLILIVVVFFELGSVLIADNADNETGAKTLYNGLSDNNALRIQNVKFDQAVLNAATNKTIALASGRSVPATPSSLLLRKVGDIIVKQGQNYNLSLRDYVVVQNGYKNDFLVLKSADANALLKQDNIAHLDRPNYGMLGSDEEEKEYSYHYNHPYGKTDKKDDSNTPQIKRVYSQEPAIMFITNRVCGVGQGFGLWYNFSSYFPYLYTLFYITINFYIFRDEGAGILFTCLTSFLALFLSYYSYSGHWFQLLAYNIMIGTPVALYPTWTTASATQKYIVKPEIIYNSTLTYVQIPTLDSTGDSFGTAFMTYLTFGSVVYYFVLSLTRLASARSK